MQKCYIMQALTELVKLINFNKLKSNGLWEILFERDSKLKQLCEGIHLGYITDETTATNLLYPNQMPGTKFYNLKERLKERLVSVAFLLEFQPSTFSSRQEAYFEANKKWSAANVFMAKGARLIGIGLLEDLLKQSIQFEFTELTLSAASLLRLHYGTIKGDQVKYDFYHRLYQEYRRVWIMESETEELYADLASKYVNMKATRLEVVETATAYYSQVAPHLAVCPAFRIQLCGRMIQMTIYTSQNDYARAAELCEEAITFFREKSFDCTLAFQVFYYQLVVSCIQLKQFDRGVSTITAYQSLYEEGTFNWYKLQEMFFLLAIHTHHYDDAVAICDRVQLHPKTSAQPAQIAEMWAIHGAYSHYLRLIGRAAPAQDGDRAARFKIGRFMNEIPTFSKDKQGMNIPILIIQILLSIQGRSYVQSIDRIEAIKKYCSRYLRQDDNFRSNCFIKLLLQIPEGSFHRQAVLRRAGKYLEQLQSVPLEIAYQTHEIEIIPYEDLWEMTIDSLPNQIVKAVRKIA